MPGYPNAGTSRIARRRACMVTVYCCAPNCVRIQAMAAASVSNSSGTGTAQRPKPAFMCQPDNFSPILLVARVRNMHQH